VQPDPLSAASNDLNLYRYCHNAPSFQRDHFGLDGFLSRTFDETLSGLQDDPETRDLVENIRSAFTRQRHPLARCIGVAAQRQVGLSDVARVPLEMSFQSGPSRLRIAEARFGALRQYGEMRLAARGSDPLIGDLFWVNTTMRLVNEGNRVSRVPLSNFSQQADRSSSAPIANFLNVVNSIPELPRLLSRTTEQTQGNTERPCDPCAQ